MKLAALKPRFSIRTMLVLTALLALLLAYHVNWIRQRQQLIDSGFVSPAIRGMMSTDVRRAPGLLVLFGVQGYFRVQADLKHDDPEMARVRGLFPEAKCVGYLFVRNRLQGRTSGAEGLYVQNPRRECLHYVAGLEKRALNLHLAYQWQCGNLLIKGACSSI